MLMYILRFDLIYESSISQRARLFQTLADFGKQHSEKKLCVFVDVRTCVFMCVHVPLPLSLCHSNAQVKCSCRLLYIIRVSKAQAARQEKWTLSDASSLTSHG